MQIQSTVLDPFMPDFTVNHQVQRISNNRLVLMEEENGFGVKRFLYGPLLYALEHSEGIPFLLIRIGGFDFDIVLNGFELLPLDQQPHLDDYQGEVSFIIIHTRTKKVFERQFVFSPLFTRQLIAILHQQRELYHTEKATRKKIRQVTEVADAQEIFSQSRLYLYE